MFTHTKKILRCIASHVHSSLYNHEQARYFVFDLEFPGSFRVYILINLLTVILYLVLIKSDGAFPTLNCLYTLLQSFPICASQPIVQ